MQSHDHTYNLMHELVKQNESVWHIKKNYFDDSEGCEACQSFWKKMVEQKEANVKELEALVKKHLG